jgi:hypothetical protein
VAAKQLLECKLCILVRREDDQILWRGRIQPRTPAANRSLRLTPDCQSLSSG